LLASVLLAAVILSGSGCDHSGDEPAAPADGEVGDLPPTEPSGNGHPKLSSKLNKLLSAYEQGEVEAFAGPTNIELLDGDKVRVTIECVPGHLEAVAETAGAYGIVEMSNRNLVQAVVPITSLTALAGVEGIRRVRLPEPPQENASDQGE